MMVASVRPMGEDPPSQETASAFAPKLRRTSRRGKEGDDLGIGEAIPPAGGHKTGNAGKMVASAKEVQNRRVMR
jgi:hypothetical protein